MAGPDDAFFTVHDGLPREGPGDGESVEWALAVRPPPPDGRVLDAGCGPGADIGALLAEVPEGEVVAMDTHAPFAQTAAESFAGEPRVTVVEGDMARPEGHFDLIWAAGAIYVLGVRAALSGWRGHLRPGGTVAVSQIAWRVQDPPEPARAFWAEAYPPMTDAAGVLAEVRAAGYRALAHRFLPDAAWEAYYGPLGRRIAALRAAGPDEDLSAALDAEEREIALWRAHRDAFGYLQVVATPE